MPQVQTIQVEVTLQDYFFAAGDVVDLSQANGEANGETLTNRDPSPSPIALETWEQWFQIWLEQLQPTISVIPHYELSLRLSDDAEIQQLNAQYRHNDQPTDVLAFAALESEQPLPASAIAELPTYLGDLVISVETAQQQAQERDHTLTQELAWLATHGLLHLLGWDHPDEASLTRMLNQQAGLLQAVGISIQYD